MDPLPHSDLTPEDYRDLVALALEEAVGGSPAKDLIASAEVCDLEGRYAGLTSSEVGDDGRLTGRYGIGVDWGARMNGRAGDAKDGKAYVAQRLTSAFHEVHHVEQKGNMFGSFGKAAAMREQEQERIEAEVTGRSVPEPAAETVKSAARPKAGAAGRPRKRVDAMCMTISIDRADKELVKEYAFAHAVTVSDLIHRWIQENCRGE